jgi:hypothetical protein
VIVRRLRGDVSGARAVATLLDWSNLPIFGANWAEAVR